MERRGACTAPRILSLIIGLIFFSDRAAADGAGSCNDLFRNLRSDAYPRLISPELHPEFGAEIRFIFESHLRKMISDLTPEQQERAIREISSFTFENLSGMGSFDFESNQIQLRSGLRGRILGLGTLLHESRHYLDFNFRPMPRADLVRELETRAFSAEYRFMNELMSVARAPAILAQAIKRDAGLTPEEGQFLEYLFRQARASTDTLTGTGLLKNFTDSEQAIARTVFGKLDKISRAQVIEFLRSVRMTEQEYVDKQLGTDSYGKRMSGTFPSRWGYAQSLLMLYAAYLLSKSEPVMESGST